MKSRLMKESKILHGIEARVPPTAESGVTHGDVDVLIGQCALASVILVQAEVFSEGGLNRSRK